MAAISGYSGSVSAGGAVGNLNEWQVTIKRDNFDISAFNQDGGWKDNLGGMVEWSGQCQGNFDIQDSGQAAFETAIMTGSTVDLVLGTGTATGTTVATGGATYSGVANVTDFDVKTPANNKVDITVKFKGKGKLTRA